MSPTRLLVGNTSISSGVFPRSAFAAGAICEVHGAGCNTDTSKFPVFPHVEFRKLEHRLPYFNLLCDYIADASSSDASRAKLYDDLNRAHICIRVTGLSPRHNASLLRKVSESLPILCQGLEVHDRLDSCELIRPCPEPRCFVDGGGRNTRGGAEACFEARFLRAHRWKILTPISPGSPWAQSKYAKLGVSAYQSAFHVRGQYLRGLIFQALGISHDIESHSKQCAIGSTQKATQKCDLHEWCALKGDVCLALQAFNEYVKNICRLQGLRLTRYLAIPHQNMIT